MTVAEPIGLFHAAVRALQQEDWNSAASLCDPVSLRAYKRQLSEQFQPRVLHASLTADMLMKHEPGLPREVAEYQVAQRQHFADPTRRLQQEFPSLHSFDEFLALEPEHVFALWIEGRSPRRQIEHIIRTGHAAPGVAAAAASMSQQWYDYVALGVVFDGADVAHVVFRQRVDEGRPWSGEMAEQLAALPPDEQRLMRESWARGMPRLCRCRRQEGGTWRLHADYDFLASGGHIAAMSEPSEAPGPQDGASDLA